MFKIKIQRDDMYKKVRVEKTEYDDYNNYEIKFSRIIRKLYPNNYAGRLDYLSYCECDMWGCGCGAGGRCYQFYLKANSQITSGKKISKVYISNDLIRFNYLS